ncbi:hypothetical protein BSYN_13840 [Bacteroides sedimenti]|uniref:Uncharacterized protein n=1 Tax=Bacteroides sedimenti TaxID=2136147 RepID=A0ABN6Z3I7_9BACE
MQYVSWDWDNDKEVVTEIKKEKYKYDILYFSLEECTDVFTIFYDNFDCKFRETDEMVFRWKGFTSVDRRYYFKRLNGIWILIKIVDYDPINNDRKNCLSKTDWDGVGATNR